jgi:hypothetical protein
MNEKIDVWIYGNLKQRQRPRFLLPQIGSWGKVHPFFRIVKFILCIFFGDDVKERNIVVVVVVVVVVVENFVARMLTKEKT